MQVIMILVFHLARGITQVNLLYFLTFFSGPARIIAILESGPDIKFFFLSALLVSNNPFRSILKSSDNAKFILKGL